MLDYLELKISQLWKSDASFSRFNPLLWVLSACSLFYGVGVHVRNSLYDLGWLPSRDTGCRVVSIGNLTVGGTGKTPMAIYLARYFQAKGFRPAILSRGYGANNEGGIKVISDGFRISMDSDAAGDEPIVLAKNLKGVPVIIGEDRYSAGRCAVEKFGSDILILDDAFQHRAVKRHFDVVLLDAELPFGNRRLLPRGPLREPKQNLKRANLFVLTRYPQNGRGLLLEELLESSFPSTPVLKAVHKPEYLVKTDTGESLPAEVISGKRVSIFAGLANPDSLRNTVNGLGGKIVLFEKYPDHHRYRREELEQFREKARAVSADIIITSEKDGVRLPQVRALLRDIYFLRIAIEFIPSAAGLDEAFSTLLN